MLKNFEDMISRFDRIHERDRQQDGRTDGRTDTTQRHTLRLRRVWRGNKTYIDRGLSSCHVVRTWGKMIRTLQGESVSSKIPDGRCPQICRAWSILLWCGAYRGKSLRLCVVIQRAVWPTLVNLPASRTKIINRRRRRRRRRRRLWSPLMDDSYRTDAATASPWQRQVPASAASIRRQIDDMKPGIGLLQRPAQFNHLP